LNVSEKVGGLINELEKAHIYIERLNEHDKRQRSELAEKDRRLAELEQRVAGMTAVEERLAQIEALLAARPATVDRDQRGVIAANAK
jgi:hypothetical protein